VRGTRTVRRLLGVVAALALVGPLSSVARPDVAAAAPTGYVTMSDGVSIAVNVRMPTNYVPGLRYPTVFEMSGYDGGSANGGTLAKDVGVPPGTPVPVDDSRQLTDYLNGEYVTVHASVRGTGCSSGEFDLFSWRSALDARRSSTTGSRTSRGRTAPSASSATRTGVSPVSWWRRRNRSI
jgi:hypothetical protein